MLKVLYIAPLSLNRKQGTGGVETATENILEGFSNINGLEIIVLSFSSEHSQHIVTKHSETITILQKSSIIKNTWYNILYYQRKVIRDIMDEESPDLVHFHGTGPNILSISNLPKDRIVITQHGINRLELKYQITFRNKLKYLLKSIIEKIYFPKFLNYIFISNNNLNFTKNYYKTDFSNYAVISNSVNTDFFNIRPKNTTNNNILYVGYISRLKNILILIKTINELKKNNKIYRLNIVGEIKDNKYYEECRQYINDNDLKDIISFKGYLDQSKLLILYDAIDIFVLPSLQENSPISLLEAMAAGRVSIASNIGGIPEIINNGKTGYIFEKNNYKELYNILSLLHNNSPLLNSIGKNAKKNTIEKYTPQYIGDLTYKYYNSIINDY
jgi:glycosyltransferase involved in cell wall biosynthesis